MQVFIHDDSAENVAALADQLSKAVADQKAAKFVAFMIFVDGKEKDIETLAAEKKIENVGMAIVPAAGDGVKGCKINLDPAVKNTVLVYKDRKVTAKFVNLDAKADAAKLAAAIAAVCK